jgi:hypothetical protein
MTMPTTEHLRHRLLRDSVTVASPCARRLRPRSVLRALITLAIVVIASPSPARAEPVFLRSATGSFTTFDVPGVNSVNVVAPSSAFSWP